MRAPAQASTTELSMRRSSRNVDCAFGVFAAAVVAVAVWGYVRLAWRYQPIAALDTVQIGAAVRLRGTVAYYSEADNRVFLQDQSGAVSLPLNGAHYSAIAGQSA